MERCPEGGYATSFSAQNEKAQGPLDDTALNSICLLCNNNAKVCSSLGSWGKFHYSEKSEAGFNGANFKREPDQGWPYDDTEGVDIKMYHDGDCFTVEGGHEWGEWQGMQRCNQGERICALRTQVEPPQGGNDDTALNGVELWCCSQ